MAIDIDALYGVDLRYVVVEEENKSGGLRFVKKAAYTRKLWGRRECTPLLYTVMFAQSHAKYAYALNHYISQLDSILIGSCCP